MPPRKYKTFSKAFKEEAVRLLEIGVKSLVGQTSPSPDEGRGHHRLSRGRSVVKASTYVEGLVPDLPNLPDMSSDEGRRK
jgi:hypothetical protein